MATQTLLQRLEAGETAMTRYQDETFLAAGAVPAGMVQFDLTKSGDDRLLYVEAGASGIFAGVAFTGVDGADDKIVVRTRGIVTVAVDGSGSSPTGAFAVNDALTLSGGKLIKAAAGDRIVAQSLEVVTSDTTAEVLLLG